MSDTQNSIRDQCAAKLLRAFVCPSMTGLTVRPSFYCPFTYTYGKSFPVGFLFIPVFYVQCIYRHLAIQTTSPNINDNSRSNCCQFKAIINSKTLYRPITNT